MISTSGLPEAIGTLIAVFIAAAKVAKDYVPSGRVVQEGQNSILTRIESMDAKLDTGQKEFGEHRIALAESIGAIQSSLAGMDARQNRTEDRVGKLERRVGTGDYKRPSATGK